ncbi:TetR family transcriptional regulator C-terminal domain-containing protein [Rhodobacter sp. 24-YEA-8]|uniref:TetR family transcriptional regulator C-terminal domain-containing protein n=1 Tax=Rhodobacter sp. 24-YEA-8 TaxID=1884310 RepID=UPI000899F965|nr:TetR family transcriptional regulator C-terminal domain-containing protein [Rhodobacter sp. 24-YEA-8]SED27417.1 transcriptional regulator, TetR family [Rhodobacter sp. 24-YEA-8]
MTQSTEGPRFRRYSSETRAAMLVEAGLACLARGGITAFTIDNICAEAAVSRGLINHHFGSKDGLLAACYATMYDRFTSAVAPGGAALRGETSGLVHLVEANFAPAVFNPDSLRIWLALWGEIANNPALRNVHRARYQDFLFQVARAVTETASSRGLTVNAHSVAVLFIALSDGLWLEQGIDPTMLSRDAARRACYHFLESFLGPLDPMNLAKPPGEAPA